jgi:hypothetical protein
MRQIVHGLRVFQDDVVKINAPNPHLFDVAGRHATFFQVLLVVVFGWKERHCRHDLSHDRLLESARLFQLFL